MIASRAVGFFIAVGSMNASIQEFPAHSRETSAPGPVDVAVQGLTKNFSTIERAIDSISFEVVRGQAVALIGSDSSGKSTLLRCCAGLMSPDAGSVTIFGKNLSDLSLKERNNLLADIAFLNGRNAETSDQTVFETILLGAKPKHSKLGFLFHRYCSGRLKQRTKATIEKFGLSQDSGKKVRELSPFQQRTVFLASTEMQSVRMILADDPVAGLDPAAAEQYMNLLLKTTRAAGITLIFTSRELIDALAYADRAIALLQGRLELDAPVGAEDARVLRTLAG